MCVFLATECLDAGGVEALDNTFEKNRFDVLLSNELGKCGQRYRFVVVDAYSQPHVDCGVYGAPLGVNTRGIPFLMGDCCY